MKLLEIKLVNVREVLGIQQTLNKCDYYYYWMIPKMLPVLRVSLSFPQTLTDE